MPSPGNPERVHNLKRSVRRESLCRPLRLLDEIEIHARAQASRGDALSESRDELTLRTCPLGTVRGRRSRVAKATENEPNGGSG